jgi:hypothetical protein
MSARTDLSGGYQATGIPTGICLQPARSSSIPTKENAHQPNTHPTQSEERVSQGLARVRQAAREHKEMKFTALLHHLTVDLLRESFYSLKRKAAPGVDGVTWQPSHR